MWLQSILGGSLASIPAITNNSANEKLPTYVNEIYVPIVSVRYLIVFCIAVRVLWLTFLVQVSFQFPTVIIYLFRHTVRNSLLQAWCDSVYGLLQLGSLLFNYPFDSSCSLHVDHVTGFSAALSTVWRYVGLSSFEDRSFVALLSRFLHDVFMNVR